MIERIETLKGKYEADVEKLRAELNSKVYASNAYWRIDEEIKFYEKVISDLKQVLN
jgi:hypothetical protein